MSQGEKKPSQARSRATREKILAGFEALLLEQPIEQISMPMIARQAGVAVGTLYGRFEGREALYPLVFEIYESRLQAFMQGPGRIEIETDKGLYDALKHIVGSAWAFLKKNKFLVRAAFMIGRQHPEAVGPQWQEYVDQAHESMRTLLSDFPDEIARDDEDRVARMTTYLLNVLPLEFGLYDQDGVGAVLSVGEAEFIEDIARTIYGYLAVDLPR